MPKIDEEQYDRGRGAFAKGVSIRALIEPLLASAVRNPDPDARELSFVLGFVDAAFDKLRGIER